MVRDIVRDIFFLSQTCEDADASDIETAQDLIDTLEANRESCVGLAANMIGVRKRIIVFFDLGVAHVMLNPELLSCSEPYEAEEGCLSLEGRRKTKRNGKIKVKYLDQKLKPMIKTYTGFTAQIIQHELDHCNGVLI